MAQYRYTAYIVPLPGRTYQVVFPAIPEIITFGESVEEARAMAQDALRCHLEGLMKDGEPIPIEEEAPQETLIKETVAISL
jgi:predicted RNase H-like HicB family nuclease